MNRARANWLPGVLIAGAFIALVGVTVACAGDCNGLPTDGLGYRVIRLAGPPEATTIIPNRIAVRTDGNGQPVSALITGSYQRTDRASTSAFIYDVFGTIVVDSTYADPDPSQPSPPQPNRFWDIEELVGPGPPVGAPEPWASTTQPIHASGNGFRGLNSTGLIAGSVRDPNGVQHGVFLDLTDPVLALTLIPPPPVSFEGYAAGNDVTELDDIVVRYTQSGVSDWQGYVYNPTTTELAVITDGPSNTPIAFLNDVFRMNSLREVVGIRGPYEQQIVIRHSMPTSTTEEFPDLLSNTKINESGQFAGTIQGRGRVKNYAARIDANGNIDWALPNNQSDAGSVNDSGDVLYTNRFYWEYYSPVATYYFSDGLQESFKLKDLVVIDANDPSDAGAAFRSSLRFRGEISNVDETGFGWIVGRMEVTLSNGGVEWQAVLLIPEALDEGPLVYNSSDTPLTIPDNKPAGVTSTIMVAEDVTVTNMTVTLNISHPRPSDLQATLIGPNNVSVPLTNLTGLNDVGNFDGGSSLGNWRIKVVDSVFKKTGTLNGWTLTIE